MQRNLMTPRGRDALKSEFDDLWHRERPEVVATVSWAAGNGDRSENGDYIYGKKRLRQIDGRLRHLGKLLESAEVIDPSHPQDPARVQFGAIVTYLDEDDREHRVQIVGHHEAELAQGTISWRSPIARALIGKRVGDVMTVEAPRGEIEIEIAAIAYPAAD